MSGAPIVQLDKVSFRYRSELVLDNVSLTIPQGDFLGIIGPNGSGKTTLLRILLGLLEPSTGSAKLFGHNALSFRDRKKIGYVPQKAGADVLRFPLTVEEVVSMAGPSKNVTKVLRAVGMEDKRHHLLSELSGGQQQRVFIARALVNEPELLILDEPTVGVDSPSQEDFYQLLRDLNEDKSLTLVLVSHDVDVVAQEVKNIMCLNCQLIYHGEAGMAKANLGEKLYGDSVRFVEHEH